MPTSHATVVLLLLALPLPAGAALRLQAPARAEPPRELHASVRKLLAGSCVRLHDGSGLLLELWFRSEVPVKATDAQVGNGLTYREVPSSTLIGAVRVARPTTDYRKQKVPAGVYTLRLAVQPVSDDHSDTAPYRDFCLLCPAAADRKPDLLPDKALFALSARTTDDHPSPLLLFPGKGAGEAAKLVEKPGGHQVLLVRLPANTGTRKATLLLGLTVAGASPKAGDSP
jgi:hypothetical protein